MLHEIILEQKAQYSAFTVNIFLSKFLRKFVSFY